MQLWRRIRDLPGVLLRDCGRFERALALSGDGYLSDPQGWISLRNRIEKLLPNSKGRGVQCEWQWGSDLHACSVLPSLGRSLMRASLSEWRIEFSDNHVGNEKPQITFLFSHSGEDRIPHLRQTIRSIFAQKGITFEVIVVDQSPTSIAHLLPAGIRYRHLSKQGVPKGWHKAWGFNVGARMAQGDLLVFQDGDICVPTLYGAELHNASKNSQYQAFSLQRFLYYLSPTSTQRTFLNDSVDFTHSPERVFQNWKGGTIAVNREAFFKVGGFDEGFVDWGGEDDEFFDRCSAIGHCRFGYIPFIHLWHAPQPDRKVTTNPNISTILPWRLGIPPRERVAELSTRNFGQLEMPSPLHSYKTTNDKARL